MTLYGHDANLAAIDEAAVAGRVHHAWLLAGPEGVGKATFAGLTGARLLARAAGQALPRPGEALPEGHPTRALIDAGSHPDLMRLERVENEKTATLARNISVAQVRGLARLFATSGTYSPRRIVIVDAADDLEAEGANALLKNLEEPPEGAVFLLVSHAPGRLLPTIRSRCRTLRFGPLRKADMAAALADAAPALPAGERAMLAEVGEGAPGRALRYAGLDVAGIDAALDRLARQGDPDNALRVAFAKQFVGKGAAERYALMLERAPARIAAAARERTGEALGGAIALWEEARDLARAAPRLSLDPQTTAFELGGMVARLAG